MIASERREKILEAIKQSNMPISASTLAQDFGVTRQVVVGDVSLLRAAGNEIIATARGYIFPTVKSINQFLGTIACKHDIQDTHKELQTIVSLGATVINVTVEHELYGEITGNLNISTHKDIDEFFGRVNSSKVRLLADLTDGVHLHQIACRDKEHFEQLQKALEVEGVLYKD
ncbi:MAG: transcription repressor NadR [Defluviitaleaceae bacterium]|nr:transcription repressor NadR [Defluviitaleaceae bacterium]